MAPTVKEVGEIENIPYDIQQIEWRIPDFFTIANDEKYPCLATPYFPITNVLWQLRLWPRKSISTATSLDLFLACESLNHKPSGNSAFDTPRKHSIEYDFGLKKCDDRVEHLVSGIVRNDESKNTMAKFIKKTQLLQRHSELAPDNILTIVCTIKWASEVSHSNTQPEAVLDETKPLKLIRFDKLSENFKNLLDNKDTCDTILKVKDKEYRAHRSVLIARSCVFAANFKHDTLEKQTGVIAISDCDPDSFQEFLDYLYSGKLEELSFRSALNLYYISDKYDVQELKTFCVEYLMQCLSVANICEVIILADKFEETALFSAVQDFFNKNVSNILLISDWEGLMKENCRLANKLLIAMTKVKNGD